MINIDKTVESKIDLFISKYIKNSYDLNKIHWIFSISGGKDSFTMAYALKIWYKNNGYEFRSTGLYISQWDNNTKKYIESKFDWLDEICIIDAYNETLTLISNTTLQAPCRQCSDVRHQLSDEFLKKYKKKGMVNFLCRGLHLSDMAVSLLWRFVWGFDTYEHLSSYGKGKPIIHLFDNNYLLKPLCFVREYESQLFAQKNNYIPAQCECPALKYPSRRDIIEESALYFFDSPLWEFDIWGMDRYIEETLMMDILDIKRLSLKGKEVKTNIIPETYYDFTLNQLKLKTQEILSTLDGYFSYSSTLDEIGTYYLKTNMIKDIVGGTIPIPKLLTNQPLLASERSMICTLGPFWGMIGLRQESKQKMLLLQEKLYGIYLDIGWGQTIELLKAYYAILKK